MRKFFVTFILILVSVCFVFADSSSDTDVQDYMAVQKKKVKVTRKQPTALTIDAGGVVFIPLDKDGTKGGGLMIGGTITPVIIKKISAGFRLEAAVFAGKDILDSDNKKKEIKVGMSGTVIANYPLAKSFEIYGGGGAAFILKDFDSFTDFSQTWGIVLQGGGRGRLNNRLGVGAELNLMFDIPNKEKIIMALGYFSLEF